jgi:hypothetical protein
VAPGGTFHGECAARKHADPEDELHADCAKYSAAISDVGTVVLVNTARVAPRTLSAIDDLRSVALGEQPAVYPQVVNDVKARAAP